MRWQLRDFRIERGQLAQFVAEWRAAVLPLRVARGFSVVGPWVVEEEDRFILILGHPDFDAADEAYYASEARAGLDPDPRRLIAEANGFFMDDPPGAAAAS
jgi:hypothetical protein